MRTLQSRLLEVETCLLKVLSAISDQSLCAALETFKDMSAPSDTLGREHHWPKTPLDAVSSVRQWQEIRTNIGENLPQATDRSPSNQEAKDAISEKSDTTTRQVTSIYSSRRTENANNHTTLHALEPDVDVAIDGNTNDFPPPPTLPLVDGLAHHDQSTVPIDDPLHDDPEPPIHQIPLIIGENSDSLSTPRQHHNSSSPDRSNGPDFPKHLFW